MYSRLLQNIFNPDTISLAIVISRNLVTINAKSKGTILVAIGVNTDTSNQLIMCLKQDTIHTAIIPWTINATTIGRKILCYVSWTIAIYQCLVQDTISICTFQQTQYYSQHFNQSGVSVLTNVFEIYMLQVKVNRCNYNSYIDIYITWLRQIILSITALLK